MTITAGNSNNGIPMGGYVPGTGSGGGGGVSGDVYRYKGSVPTYTALPAENLETGDVYNVIDTDMNYAWTGTAWDPLGSTVDLSPYYTANQVDAKLLQKQGLLTPQGALSINTYVKSNLQGMSYTPDGTGIYSTTNWGLTAPTNNSSVPFSFNGTFASSTWGPNSIPSYISIPYSMGQVVITPVKNYYRSSSGNIIYHYSTICAWAGKTLEDGTFIPILPIRAAGTYRISSASSWSYSGAPVVTSSDTPTTNTATSVVFSYTTPPASSQTNIAGSIGQPSGTNVFQMFEDEDTGAISIYIMSNSQSASRGYTYTDLEVCARLKEIDSVLFIPSANGGYISSGMDSAEIGVESVTAVNVSDIGLYSASAPVTSLTFASLGENLFDLTGETAKNYLELAIDNSTIKINSSNQLYADIDTTAAVATADTAGIVRPTGNVLSVNAEGDLSADTYNKMNIDAKLLKKQDTLTPSGALSITKEVRSNLQGFQYTTNGLGVYKTGSSYWSNATNLYNYWWVADNGQNTDLPGTTLNPETFANKIVIPYSLGQVVSVPVSTGSASAHMYRFGKLLEDGTFIPIAVLHGSYRYITSSDTPQEYKVQANNLMIFSVVDVGQSYTNLEIIVSSGEVDFNTKILIQLFEDTDGSLWFSTNNELSYYSSQGRVTKAQKQYTDTAFVNRLKEIDCCVLLPCANAGQSETSAMPVSAIGLYNNPGSKLYDLITSENYNNIDLGENLFDLSGEQAYNYLDLNIDNSTIKVNDSGQLYADASYVLPAANATTLGGIKVSTGSTSTSNASNIYIDSNNQVRLIDYPKVKTIEYTARAGTPTQFGLININSTSMLGTSSNLGVTNNYSCYIHADGNSGEVVAQAPSGIGSNAYGRLQIKDYNNGASNYCELFLNANKNAWHGVIDPHNRITSNTDILEISRYIDGYQVYHNIDTGNLQDNIVAGTNITTSVDDDGKVTINAIGSGTLPENVTTQGNTFNGANQLVQLDSSGKLPAIDGSQLTNLPGYTLPAATASTLGGVKPDGTTITVDEDGTIHSTQEGFADLAANNVFTGTNQFQSNVTVGNGFNTAVLNMGPGSGLIFSNSSQAGGKTLSLGTQIGTQVTIYSDGVPIIQRSETRTNQSSSDDNPYTKYDNVDSGNINDILGISFWKGTQTEYDGITEKDANTLYIITG